MPTGGEEPVGVVTGHDRSCPPGFFWFRLRTKSGSEQLSSSLSPDPPTHPAVALEKGAPGTHGLLIKIILQERRLFSVSRLLEYADGQLVVKAVG